MISLPKNQKKIKFLTQRFEVEFFVLILCCYAIQTISVILPFVYSSYAMHRAYCQMLTILSLFFVIGGMLIAEVLRRPKLAWVLILLVLIPNFMLFNGSVENLCGVHTTIYLNSEGLPYDAFYIHDQESYCASWLRYHTHSEELKIYTDASGGYPFISVALFPPKCIRGRTLTDEEVEVTGGYIYLSYFNVVKGKLHKYQYGRREEVDITDYQARFINRNKIYTNGGSELYK